ncbi:MAG: hypothetical protein Q8S54_07865 [Bacteroidota bacterium]|nr:hypothetical protein [Bacteroidota bacterium]
MEFITAELPDTNIRKMIGEAGMHQNAVIVGNRNQIPVEGTVKGWRKG